MLRHCATIAVSAIACLSGMAMAWAQESPFRGSFAETAPTVAPENRYAPQGGLDRALPSLAPLPPAPVVSPMQSSAEPATTASIDTAHGPEGIAFGGVDIFPSVEFRGGFQELSDNRSGFGAVVGAVSGRGNAGLFDIDFSLAANAESDGDGFGPAELDGSLAASADINRHLALRGDVLAAHNPQEGLTFGDENSLSNLPDETVYGGGIELLLTGNRARLAPRLRTERHDFSDAANAADLNYLQSELGLRTSYEFSPMLTVFADGASVRTDFDRGIGSDGLERGSQTRSLVAGASYTPGDWLRADVSAGVERAEFDDGSDLSGLRASGAIDYRLSALTSVSLAASHGISDDVATAGGVRQTRLGLDMVHRFRSYLELSAGLGYLRETRPGAGTQARLDAEASLAYAVRQGIYLTAGGEISRLQGSGETDWQVYMGLKLAR